MPDSGNRSSRWQWLPVGVFVLFTALNMLDRQLLAAVAPALRKDFGLSNAQYGGVLSVFFLVSTIASPLAGLFIDRVGLGLGASIAIVVWSVSGAFTGFTNSLRGLMACRFGLGFGESGGSAAPGAVLARYMSPERLAVGGAMLAAGTSLGSISAPLVVAALAPSYGWRSVFVLCGALGLLWVPLWALASKFAPARIPVSKKSGIPLRNLLKDRRLWGVIAAYSLSRQTLWTSWTTLYFVQQRGLTMIEANRRFSWYAAVFGAAAAFAVGALVMRWIRQGSGGLEARLKACWMLMPVVAITAAIPFIGSTTVAAVAVGLSFAGSVGIWSSVHLIPIDLYGVGRAAFTYSLLECAFAGVQSLASPAIGAAVDRYGFNPVCIVMPLLPLAGVAVLQLCCGGRKMAAKARESTQIEMVAPAR